MKSTEEIAALKSILVSAVELLKEEGLQAAGTADGLLAYQVLGDIKAQAEAVGMPLDQIGLDGIDLDALLNKPRKAA